MEETTQKLPIEISYALSEIMDVQMALRSLIGVLCASSEIRYVEVGNILSPIGSKLSDALKGINRA